MNVARLEKLEAELARMSDGDVERAYLDSNGMPDNHVSDLLAGELERRGLDE